MNMEELWPVFQLCAEGLAQARDAAERAQRAANTLSGVHQLLAGYVGEHYQDQDAHAAAHVEDDIRPFYWPGRPLTEQRGQEHDPDLNDDTDSDASVDERPGIGGGHRIVVDVRPLPGLRQSRGVYHQHRGRIDLR